MKQNVQIKNRKIIDEILQSAEYGTLALCKDNIPYSIPMNYTYFDNSLYFHGSKTGRKIDIMKENLFASFSVVEPYSVIQSYFSSNDNLACPATHFFRSVICDGQIEFVNDYDEKVSALESLMQKLQPEGKYTPLTDEVYKKRVDATNLFKINIKNIEGKLKLGQNLPQKRYEMILDFLEKRGYDLDKKTILQMNENR